MPSLPADSLGRRVVMIDGWNEWAEGHYIMPSTLAGFDYLDILREVFGQGSSANHEDSGPSDMQKKRFNVLFPRDFTPELKLHGDHVRDAGRAAGQ